MSAAVQAALDPTTEPAAPVGGLLRAELRRFGARRFIRLLLALGVLGWLVAVAIGLTQFGHPSAGDLATARHQVDQTVTESNAGRQQCLDDPPPAPSNVPADQV